MEKKTMFLLLTDELEHRRAVALRRARERNALTDWQMSHLKKWPPAGKTEGRRTA